MSKHGDNDLPVAHYSQDHLPGSIVKELAAIDKPDSMELRVAAQNSERPRKRNRYNSPGQGRKITYSEQTDAAIASHIRDKLESSDKVTIQYVCSYAKQAVCQENPSFVASSGWAHRFLTRHGIVLQNVPKYKIRSLKSGHVVDYKGRPLSYSPDTDLQLAEFVREQQAAGAIVTNSSLRNHARSVIQKESPNFTASASWAQNFLLRHRLSLSTSFAEKRSSDTAKLDPASSQAKRPTEKLPISNSGVPETEQPLTGDNSVTSYTLLSSFRDVPESSSHNAAKQGSQTAAVLTPEAGVIVKPSLPAPPLILSHSRPQQQQHLPTQTTQIMAAGSFTPHQDENVSNPSALTGDPSFSTWSPATSSSLPTLPLEGDDKSSPARCRPLSYPRETDQTVADWVRSQQEAGEPVTFSKLRSYAKQLIQSENPTFNASVGWVTPFLLRHNLDLSVNKKTAQACDGQGSSSAYSEPTSSLCANVPGSATQSSLRLRHTLDDKYDVVKIIKNYGLSLQQTSRILGIAVSTLSGWVKMASARQEESEAQSLPPPDKTHEDTVVQWVWSQIQQGQPLDPDQALAYAQSIANCEVFDRDSLNLQQCSSVPCKGGMPSPGDQDQGDSGPGCTFSPEVELYLVSWIQQSIMEQGRLGISSLTKFIYSLPQESIGTISLSLGSLFRFLIKNSLQLDPKPLAHDTLPSGYTTDHVKLQEKEETTSSADLSFVGNYEMYKSQDRSSVDEMSVSVHPSSAFATSPKQSTSTISSDVLLSLSSVAQVSPTRSASPTAFTSKAARDFTKLEKEEVVKYANSATLQKAAIKYGVAAPTVWRWRVELNLNSPRFSLEEKKAILCYTEENGAKSASKKFGVSTRTIHNWRKVHSPEQMVSKASDQDFPYPGSLEGEQDLLRARSEIQDDCNPPFDFIMLAERPSMPAAAQAVPSPLSSQVATSLAQDKPMDVVVMPEQCDVEYDVGPAGHSQTSYTLRWRMEEKLEILKYAQIHSPKIAAERFGISLPVLQQWMKVLGVPTVSPADVSVYLSASFHTRTQEDSSSSQGQGEDTGGDFVPPELGTPSKHASGLLSSGDGRSEVVASPSDLLAPVSVKELVGSTEAGTPT